MNEINVKCPLGDSLYWHGCYDSSIKFDKYITGESFAHPAKMSRLLCDRIFRHLKKLGLLKKDSTVVDFMSGIGTTNMIASLHGYKTIGIELEKHFIKMQESNKALLEDKIGRKVSWDILQGDSRKLSEILKDKGGAGIISPPFLDVVPLQDKNFMIKSSEQRSRNLKEGKSKGHYASPEAMKRAAEKIMPAYSSNSSNIGNLPDKPLVGVVSPPYSRAQEGGGIAKNGYRGKHMDEQGKDQPDKVGDRCGYSKHMHGDSNGQIGNLPDKPLVGVVSPPYIHGAKGLDETSKESHSKRSDRSAGGPLGQSLRQPEGYSEHPNNIGNLKDNPLVGVVSPPYANDITSERSFGHKDKKTGEIVGKLASKTAGKETQNYNINNPDNIGTLKDNPLVGITSPPYGLGEGIGHSGQPTQVVKDLGLADKIRYGKTDGNIGNQVNDSYLSAMLQVYQESFKSGISPLVTVTKNPTRKGELRRLDLDTAHLLELAGYRIIDYHRAVLFEERTQMTLDGDVKKIPKGRLSFFKRLSYQKGSPVARWEDILIAIRTEMG